MDSRDGYGCDTSPPEFFTLLFNGAIYLIMTSLYRAAGPPPTISFDGIIGSTPLLLQNDAGASSRMRSSAKWAIRLCYQWFETAHIEHQQFSILFLDRTIGPLPIYLVQEYNDAIKDRILQRRIAKQRVPAASVARNFVQMYRWSYRKISTDIIILSMSVYHSCTVVQQL